LALILLGGLLYLGRDTKLVSAVPMVSSLTRISWRGGTAETRLIAWEIAVKAFKERPIFGWGPENFYYAFNLFYNPKSLEHGFYETWFDRSHNIFFDYLSMGGLLGLLSYLGLFAMIFWQLLKNRQQLRTSELAVTLMFFCAYLLQNFFVFDHLSSYLTFFIFLAWTDNLLWPRGREAAAVNYNLFLLVAAVTAASLAAIYFGNLMAWRANQSSFQAQLLLRTNAAAGLEKYRRALSMYSPHHDDIVADFSRILATTLPQKPQFFNEPPIRAAWQTAIEELKQTLNKHPRELNAHLFLAQLYALLLNDQSFANLSEGAFAEALKLSPKRQQVLYHWSRLKLLRRDYDGARQLLTQALNDDPKISLTYWYLGVLEAEAGNFSAAAQFINDALKRGYGPQNDGEFIFAADILKNTKDYARARDLYNAVLTSRPNDAGLMLNLSEVYMLLGDKLRAAELAERAALYDPKALETAKKWLR